MLFLSTILFSLSAYASHIAVAEIWYEYDTLTDYKVHLRLFRDCSGVSLPQTQTISLSSALQSVNTNHTLSLTNNYYQSYCTATSCQNPASNIPGYQIFEYSGTVSVPLSSSDWVFSWTSCCRNVSTNLSGAAATYVEATLNNSIGLFSVINNAPSVPYAVPLFFTTNASNQISFAGIEIDGDSLDYQFINPKASAVANAAFMSPYTANNPFPNSGLNLNPQTGLMTFTATMLGTYFFAIQVREYRNGVMVSSAVRDYQFVFVGATTTNNLPQLSGINGTNVFVRNINLCGPANMNFTINSSDLDLTDSTEISVIAKPSAATFTNNTAQNQTGTFSWSPLPSDVRAQPYLLVLKVKDNNCGISHQVYRLFVNNCNTDSVWAGDANADFVCDNFDVLSVGLANNATGPARPGATINWQAEWCANWTNNFISNINYKHADCNGDGTVNASDLAAITANYGQIHAKNSLPGQYKTLGLPDLYCDVSNLQAFAGSTLSIPIMLGSSAAMMNDFYGIAATVELINAQTSMPLAVTKNVSWIGNASNSFSFDKSLQANKAAFTFVRNDQQNLMNQHGQIGEIVFPIDVSSVVGSKVIVQFSDIRMIKNNGEEINDYNVLSDTISILSPQDVGNYHGDLQLKLYPNPSSGKSILSFQHTATGNCFLKLMDVTGRVLRVESYENVQAGKQELAIDLNGMASGQYVIELSTGTAKQSLMLMKQ